jgi:DNA-binding response OmpR family regulator
MSMGTTEEEIIHAFKIGIDDFITRPLNLRILQTFMERVIERLRGEDEPIL